jgi:hypothetical protein
MLNLVNYIYFFVINACHLLSVILVNFTLLTGNVPLIYRGLDLVFLDSFSELTNSISGSKT